MLAIPKSNKENEENSTATYVLILGNSGDVVDQDEVDMVGSPAHDEDGDHHREHLHYPLLVLPALVQSCWGYQHKLQDCLLTFL